MKTSLMRLTGLALVVGLAGSMHAQSELAVPGAPVARDVPGARELPDPNRVYKVVFSIGKPAPNVDKVDPALIKVATYVNTLVKYGVPADHRKIAVVFHQAQGWEMILKNDAYRVVTEGRDNPNIEMIQKLHQAGVDFRVCGQSVVGHKANPKDVLTEIQIDLWAMTTMVNLQLDGYVHIGL